jgi:hypothetical protein
MSFDTEDGLLEKSKIISLIKNVYKISRKNIELRPYSADNKSYSFAQSADILS